MYYLGNLTTFEKKEINVKQYIRKGKIVRNSKRKINKKNVAIKSAITGAAILGVSGATYLLLKKRYTNNISKLANKLKVNDSLGEVYSDDIDNMIFSIGGMGDLGKATTIEQSNAISTFLKRNLKTETRKKQKFIDFNHEMEVPSPFFKTNNNRINGAYYIPVMLKNMSKPFFKGYNEDSFKIAEKIYNYHLKNPSKNINIVGYSVGSNIAKDVQAILNAKKINSKIVTIGGVNFGIVKPTNSLHLMGDKDNFNFLKHSNSINIKNIKSHSLKDYILDDKNKPRQDVADKINNYLFY